MPAWGAPWPRSGGSGASGGSGGASPQGGKYGSAAAARPSVGKPLPQPPQQPPQPPSGAVKRAATPASAAAPVASASAPATASTSMKVTTLTKKSDLVSTTLVGTYAEKGSNHGRKYYQKVEKIPGHPNVNVFLYYWDARDGADFSGWWFGDQLGGTQVWSRAAVHTPTPPKGGWRIPWDAPTIQAGALIVEPVTAASTSSAAASSRPASQPPAAARTPSQPVAAARAPTQPPVAGVTTQQRLKKATDEVTAVEKIVNLAINAAKKTLENENATEVAVKGSLDALQKQVAKLSEVQTSLTKDVAEARKAGPSATNDVTSLLNLAPKIKTLQASVTAEVNKVKARQVKLANEKQKAEAEKKKKDAEEEAKKKEAKDSSEFAAMLPKVTAIVVAAQEAVEAIGKAAAPLVEKGEASESELTAIEKSAADANKKVTDARTDVTAKIALVGKYAAEARKKAQPELSQLQSKLSTALKLVGAYKNFKKEFAARVAARKALKEFTDKLDSLEADIKQADGLAKPSGMSEEEVVAIDKLITPTSQSLSTLVNQVGQKGKTADAATSAELEQLKTRGANIRTKLEAVSKKVKGQRDELLSQKALVAAREKVDKAEETFNKCLDAEMPFLKGIEVLPKAESDKALSDSDAATSDTQAAINEAKALLKSTAAEAKRYAPELAQSVTDQLKPLTARIEAAEGKLDSFRKDTTERKTNALLAEVVESINEVEFKVSNVKDAATILAANVEASTVDEIRSAIEKTVAAEKEATAVSATAKKIMSAKQKMTKNPQGAAGMSKLQNRFNVAQSDLGKQRALVEAAEKVIKLKQVLEQQTERLTAAEADVAKAEQAVPGSEGEFSEEAVRSMDEAMTSASKTLKSLPGEVQPHIAGAPAETKAKLQKLLEGSKTTLEKLDKLRQSTKEKREKVLSAVFIKDIEAKANAIEAAVTKLSDVELPFLMGMEVLPLGEAKNTVVASEVAVKATQDAITGAKAYISQKTIEVKQFGEAAAAPVNEAFKEVNARVAAAATKVAAFSKETAKRKKTAQMQEAMEMVSQTEAGAKKTLEAAEPFMKEGAENMSEEEATEPLKVFLAIEEDAKKKISETKAFLAERIRGSKDNAEHMETLKKLQARLTEVHADMTKARKSTAAHEQRFTAKRLVVDANEKIKSLGPEVEKATAACAEMLERGGKEFLVIASIRVLAAALVAHMKEKSLDLPALFKEASGGKGTCASQAFLTFLEALPAASGREEVDFTAERRMAIFTLLDADKDGALSASEFAGIFKEQGMCTKGISLTDGFAIASSKTVGKLELNDEFETIGAPREDEGGILRSEVKLLSGESEVKQGWITVKGNQGTTFVQFRSAYDKYCKEMDAAMNAAQTNIKKVSTFLTGKIAEAAGAAAGSPMTEARTELTKLKKDAAEASASLETLRKKVAQAKVDFAKTEKAERNAHILAKTKKEAEGIVGVARPSVEAAVAASKVVDEKAQPLVSLQGDDLHAFATPVSILEAVEALACATVEKVEAARKCVKEQIAAAGKVQPPTAGSAEAKKQLQTLQIEIEQAVRLSKKAFDSAKSRCQSIVDKVIGEVEKALRQELQEKKLTCETFLEQLTGGKPELEQSAFCGKVVTLESLKVPEEHAKLVARRIASSATNPIPRRAFMAFLQKYAAVVKDIALTTVFDVNTTKTIRKAERDEILEILEGPQKDEKLGVERVRVRSILDNTEGWVSVKGNQGTCFLRDTPKPMYTLRSEIALEKDFSSAEPVRTLAADEILEVLEGPRKQVFPDTLRARVKVGKDGAIGWVTLRDRMEVVYADTNPKLYTCVSSVAMTDGGNIQDCKVLRKLAVGELFEASGEVQEENGVFRVQGTAKLDGLAGWITTKGNAGTVYAQTADKIYSVKKEVDLQKSFSTSVKPDTIRKLEVGETFDLLAAPKEEKVPAEIRVKVRAQSDRAVGWITKKDAMVVKFVESQKVAEKLKEVAAPSPSSDKAAAAASTSAAAQPEAASA